MKWLQDMVDQGLVRPEVQTSIINDVEMMKQASYGEFIKKTLSIGGKEGLEGAAKTLQTMHGPIDSTLQYIAGPLAMMIASAAGTYAGVKTVDKVTDTVANFMKSRSMVKDFKKSISKIDEDTLFKGDDIAKAKKLFAEMATFAPLVAQNYPVARQVIKTSLNTGFKKEDIQNMMAMQAHIAQSGANSLPPIKAEQMGKIAGDLTCMFLDREMTKQANIIDMLAGKTSELAKQTNVPSLYDSIKSIPAAVKIFASLAALPLAANVAGGLTNMIIDKIKSKSLKKDLDHNFETILKSTPHLNDNKEVAREAYELLSHFSPHVALQPTAAKAFMTKLVEGRTHDSTIGVDLGEIKTLSDIQKHNKPGQSSFSVGSDKMNDILGTNKLIGKHNAFSNAFQLGFAEKSNLDRETK